MNYDKVISELDEMREHINNAITDTQAVCRAHDNEEQVENGLYRLADAAKDIICLSGYYMKRDK